MNEKSLLNRLLGHDHWTTCQILGLAATLSDQQLDHEFDIGHKTVRRTLDHLIRNIECWTDLMTASPVRPRPDANLSIAFLAERHETASSEFMHFAHDIVEQNRLDEAFLDPLDDPPCWKSYGGAFVHLATHGMHHRAQLLFMLRRLGVENLPEGDALSWERSVKERPEELTPAISHLEQFNAQQIPDCELKKILLTQESNVWKAVIEKDGAALNKLFADGYFEITLEGKRITKAKIVEVSPQIDEIKEFTIDSERVVALGVNSAILSYHLRLDGRTGGVIITPKDRWATSIWSCSNGIWLCRFFQQSPYGLQKGECP